MPCAHPNSINQIVKCIYVSVPQLVCWVLKGANLILISSEVCLVWITKNSGLQVSGHKHKMWIFSSKLYPLQLGFKLWTFIWRKYRKVPELHCERIQGCAVMTCSLICEEWMLSVWGSQIKINLKNLFKRSFFEIEPLKLTQGSFVSIEQLTEHWWCWYEAMLYVVNVVCPLQFNIWQRVTFLLLTAQLWHKKQYSQCSQCSALIG